MRQALVHLDHTSSGIFTGRGLLAFAWSRGPTTKESERVAALLEHEASQRERTLEGQLRGERERAQSQDREIRFLTSRLEEARVTITALEEELDRWRADGYDACDVQGCQPDYHGEVIGLQDGLCVRCGH